MELAVTNVILGTSTGKCGFLLKFFNVVCFLFIQNDSGFFALTTGKVYFGWSVCLSYLSESPYHWLQDLTMASANAIACLSVDVSLAVSK